MQKHLALAVGIAMLFLAGYVVRTSLVPPPLKGVLLTNSFDPQSSAMYAQQSSTFSSAQNLLNASSLGMTDPAAPDCPNQTVFGRRFIVIENSSNAVMAMGQNLCAREVVPPVPLCQPDDICVEYRGVEPFFEVESNPRLLGTLASGVPQYMVEGQCRFDRGCNRRIVH